MDAQIDELRRALLSQTEENVATLCFQLEASALEKGQAEVDKLAICLSEVASEEDIYSSGEFGSFIMTVNRILRDCSERVRQDCAKSIFSLFKMLSETTARFSVTETVAEFLPPQQVCDFYAQALQVSTNSQKLAIIHGISWVVGFRETGSGEEFECLEPILHKLIKDTNGEVREYALRTLSKWDNSHRQNG